MINTKKIKYSLPQFFLFLSFFWRPSTIILFWLLVVVDGVSFLFHLFIYFWQQQEERSRRREERSSSLSLLPFFFLLFFILLSWDLIFVPILGGKEERRGGIDFLSPPLLVLLLVVPLLLFIILLLIADQISAVTAISAAWFCLPWGAHHQVSLPSCSIFLSPHLHHLVSVGCSRRKILFFFCVHIPPPRTRDLLFFLLCFASGFVLSDFGGCN